jgi:hypothetical protein
MSAVMLIAQATAQLGDNVVAVPFPGYPARHADQCAEVREVAATPATAGN